MARTVPVLNRDPPELLGDADLLTRLLAAAKVKHPRATANALPAESERTPWARMLPSVIGGGLDSPHAYG
jgi:hypothetical protein